MKKEELIERVVQIINSLDYKELSSGGWTRCLLNNVNCYLIIEHYGWFGGHIKICEQSSMITVAESKIRRSESKMINNLIKTRIKEFQDAKKEEVFPGILRDNKLKNILND